MKFSEVTMVVSAVLLTTSLCLAQGAFDKEIGTDVDALAAKVDFDMSGWGKVHGMSSGKGQTPYLAALGHPPKRVALVSFYAYDPGDTKGFGSPYFGGRSETTRQLTSDGAGAVATLLHDQGITALKKSLEAYGMQLLTPDEYLDSDAKREIYDNFVLELGIGTKFGKGDTDSTFRRDSLREAALGKRAGAFMQEWTTKPKD